MKRQIGNPYLPSYEYVPDAEPYVFGDRLYVYGSHDRFGSGDFCMNNYVGWSAPLSDLSDWKYEGVIYNKNQDPQYESDLETRLFAPDVQKGFDNRYYLYYGVAHTGTINVAVCNTPAGKYEYYGTVQHSNGTPLGKKQGDEFQYDPAVLVENGKVYLYSGFCFDSVKIPKLNYLPQNNKGAMAFVLSCDMITVQEGPYFVAPCSQTAKGTSFDGHGFFEAASIRKIDNTYYFIYSSENGHELCYATSNSPINGFQFRGTLVSNGDVFYNKLKVTEPINYTGTNHGSIEKINGEWYVFYHRQSGGSPYARQGCAEKIKVLEDGSIPQVNISSNGLLGMPFTQLGVYSASLACCLMSKNGACEYLAKSRVDEMHPYLTQDERDSSKVCGQYVHNLSSGSKVGFRYFSVNIVKNISVTVRGDAKGVLYIFDSEKGKCIGEILINADNNWAKFKTSFYTVPNFNELWFCFDGVGSLDLFEFCLQ